MLKDVEVVVPELIFDEVSHHRSDCPQEPTGIGNRIQWQIGDNVSPFVVLTHLIARRREERQQYLVFRMLTTQLFHQRASLFELS